MSGEGARRPDGEVPDLWTAPVGDRIDLTPPAQVARAALNRAKDAARARGLTPGFSGRPRPLQASGAGPSERDPQLVAEAMTRLLRDRGWTAEVTVSAVMGRWREVVGDHLADHCAPETFENKVLVVRADSSAWATQVRILVPQLLDRMAQEVGAGVVETVTVLGPSGPSFRRGRRAVRGPGPGDTWG